MTPKEAIERLKLITDNEAYSDYFQEVCRTAIEALEKQIAKKPKMWSENSEWSLIPFELPFGDWGYECPCCGSRDIDYPDHHCKCGQILNWSEEE